MTNITRTQIIEGISVPAFILNGNHQFVELQVYRDGLVYCWEMVDLELFMGKLNANWVVPSIPNKEALYIHGLGTWVIENSAWLYSKDSFYEYVHSLVQQLNPKMENLYNCHGRTTEKKGGVNVSIFGVPDARPYYEKKPNAAFPDRVYGKTFQILFKEDGGILYLAALTIFKDGGVEITHLPQKKVMKFSDIEILINDKKLMTIVPAGQRVHVYKLGSFLTFYGRSISIENKYKEMIDTYNEFMGIESSLEKCQRLLEAYKEHPTELLKNELKEAYESVPGHLRMYIGDMDTKDIEVRMIIYGEQEIEQWSHYIIAKESGEPLPYIKIPKLRDDE